jgi:hypothetical protein
MTQDGYLVGPEEVAKLAAETVRAADNLRAGVQSCAANWFVPAGAFGDLPAGASLTDSLTRTSRAMEMLVGRLARANEIDATGLLTVVAEYRRNEDAGSSVFDWISRWIP